MTVAPSPRRRSACSFSDWVSTPSDDRKLALPKATILPPTVPVAPLPVGEVESFHLAEIEIVFLRRPHDGIGKRMLA